MQKILKLRAVMAAVGVTSLYAGHQIPDQADLA